MRGVELSVVRRFLPAGLVASLIPAVAYGQRADSGIVTVGNAAGARTATWFFDLHALSYRVRGGDDDSQHPGGDVRSEDLLPAWSFASR